MCNNHAPDLSLTIEKQSQGIAGTLQVAKALQKFIGGDGDKVKLLALGLICRIDCVSRETYHKQKQMKESFIWKRSLIFIINLVLIKKKSEMNV